MLQMYKGNLHLYLQLIANTRLVILKTPLFWHLEIVCEFVSEKNFVG